MNEDVKSENLRIHSRADELIACLEGEIAKRDARIVELQRYEHAFNEWHDKTEWVQAESATLSAKYLGCHRADVMRSLIDDLRAELAACRIAVENCEVFRARIAELESRYQRDVYGLNNECDPIGGDPAGGYANDNARLRSELTAIKAQEPAGWTVRGPDGRLYLSDYATEDEDEAGLWPSTLIEGFTVVRVYAAPVSEAKAQGVAMPAELARAFITGESCDGVYRVVIQSETLKEMQAVHRWLARLNAAPVQQVSVPDGWRELAKRADDFLYSLPETDGVLRLRADLCTMLAAPAAPAADAGIVDMYRHLQKVTPYRFKKIQDASVTDGGDVMYFHKDRFDAALLADMAAHCAAKGVV